MGLKDLVKHAKKFQEERFWKWEEFSPEEKEQYINFLALAISGEAGEIAEIAKKLWREKLSRGKVKSTKNLNDLKEEIVDVFIYVLLAADYLNIDLEKEYLGKMGSNEKRFTAR